MALSVVFRQTQTLLGEGASISLFRHAEFLMESLDQANELNRDALAWGVQHSLNDQKC